MLNIMQPERAIDLKLAQLVTEYNNGGHIPAHDLLEMLGSFGFVLQEPWLRSFEIKHISFKGGYPVLIDASGRIALMGYDKATADRIVAGGKLHIYTGEQPTSADAGLSQAVAVSSLTITQTDEQWLSEKRLQRACDLWRAIVGKTNSFEVAIGAIDSAWRDGELERVELDAMLRHMCYAPAQLSRVERLVGIQVINEDPPSVGFLVTDKGAFLYRCHPELSAGDPSTPAYREAFGKEATFAELDDAIAELEKQL